MNSILTLFLLNNVNFTTQRCTLHILNSLCLCNYAPQGNDPEPQGNDPEPQGNDPEQNTDRNRHAEIVLARRAGIITNQHYEKIKTKPKLTYSKYIG